MPKSTTTKHLHKNEKPNKQNKEKIKHNILKLLIGG